jgi:hypothetical protein
MRTLLVVGLLAVLALAGCSGKDSTYTCTTGPKAGKEIDLSTVPGSGADGFTPESACPKDVAPSIDVLTLPKEFTAFSNADVQWQVLNGTYAGGHSMLNELRLSQSPVADADLTQDNFNAKYPVQKLFFAHQDLPQKFGGKITFDCSAVGMWHARVFAEVQGTTLSGKEYWSPETMIMVNLPPASGKTTTVELPQAFPAQKAPTTASLAVGDAFAVKNSGAASATVHYGAHPDCFTPPSDESVAAGGTSKAVPLVVPGSYTVHVYAGSDQSATSSDVTINVAQP